MQEQIDDLQRSLDELRVCMVRGDYLGAMIQSTCVEKAGGALIQAVRFASRGATPMADDQPQDELERLTRWLEYERVGGPIDLRYRDGSWAVMVPLGNAMTVVPESHAPTAVEALRLAVERWKSRSPGNPFVP